MCGSLCLPFCHNLLCHSLLNLLVCVCVSHRFLKNVEAYFRDVSSRKVAEAASKVRCSCVCATCQRTHCCTQLRTALYAWVSPGSRLGLACIKRVVLRSCDAPSADLLTTWMCVFSQINEMLYKANVAITRSARSGGSMINVQVRGTHTHTCHHRAVHEIYRIFVRHFCAAL